MNIETKKKFQRNIWKIYVIVAFAAFTFFYGIIIVLYYQNFGLSFTQISILTVLALATVLILEVPTGAFADLVGRKKSVIIGGAALIMGMGVLTFFSTFYMFLVAAFFIGIAMAFWSGAWEAIMFQSLKAINKEKEYIKMMSKTESLFLGIGIIAAYLSPYLFSLNVRYPLYLSLAASIGLTLFMFTLYEPDNRKHKFTLKQHYNQIKDGLVFTWKKPIVMWLIAFAMLIHIMWQIYGDIMQAPYIIEIGFNLKEFAFISLIIQIIQTIFVFYSHKIESKIKDKYSFLVITLVFPLALFSILFLKNYLISIVLGIFWSLATYSMIVTSSYINHHLKEENRATVLSIQSMAISLVGVIIIPIFGFIIDKTSLSFTIFLLSMLSLSFGSKLLILRYSGNFLRRIFKHKQ